LIGKGDLPGVKEAVEKSLAEGSQSFEQDIARLITEGLVTRDEGLQQADSPTNLLWRMQNDMTSNSRVTPKKEESDSAVYTELMIDVYPEPANSSAMPLWPVQH
jgi:twitching motility protein PilU